MRYIVAFLFAIYSFTAFGETLIARDYNVLVKPKLAKQVNIKKIQRPRIFRSNTLRLQSIVNHKFQDIEVDDTDIIVDRRRWDKKLFDNNQELDISDHAKTRLFLARTLALRKYLEVHGNQV